MSRRLPNCDCGRAVYTYSGKVCGRCGCVHCSYCTKTIRGAHVCQGCMKPDERQPRLLVILQNPYDRGVLAKGFTPGRWKLEYAKSRVCQRLERVLPRLHYRIHFTNANPRVGVGPDSCHEPDFNHLRRTLKRVKPFAVLACGAVAEAAIIELRKPGHNEREALKTLVIIPHPAFRLLHNNTLVAANRFLCRLAEQSVATRMGLQRVAFRQLRNGKFREDTVV